MSDHQAAAANSASRTETSGAGNPLTSHPIVSRSEWLEARKALLAKEKAFTKSRDQLNAEQRALPWVESRRTTCLTAPRESDARQLFSGRSQLFIKHFMMGPGQKQQCVGCSFEVDSAGLTRAFRNLRPETRSGLCSDDGKSKRSKAHGLELHLGFVTTATSTTTSTCRSRRADRSGTAYLQFSATNPGMEDLSGSSVFFKDDAGQIFHTYTTTAAAAKSFSAPTSIST